MTPWCLRCGDHAHGECRRDARDRIVAWVTPLGYAHCVSHRDQREGDAPMRAVSGADGVCDWPGCGVVLGQEKGHSPAG